MTSTLTVRVAGQGDASTLIRLAQLDEDAPLSGEVLLAEADGRPVAALSLRDRRAVADPFVASAGAVALLRLRARQLARGHSPGRGRLTGFRTRLA